MFLHPGKMTVWLFLFSLPSFPLLWRLGLSPVNPLAAAAGDSVTGLRRTRGVEWIFLQAVDLKTSERARGARGPGEAPRLSLSAGYLFGFLVVIASAQPSSPFALEGHACQTGPIANLRAPGFLSPLATAQGRGRCGGLDCPARWLRTLPGRAGWGGPCGRGSWFVGSQDGLFRADLLCF